MRPLAIRALTAVSAIGRGSAAIFDALDRRDGGLVPVARARIGLDWTDPAWTASNGIAPDGAEAGGTEARDRDSGWLGRVADVEAHALPARLAHFECRNNRLADMALNTDGFAETVATARARLGAHRIGVIVGTSTSGIAALEVAYANRAVEGDALPAGFDYKHTHDLSSLAAFVRDALDLAGPALTVSAACASSARCFVDAVHFIETGVCDAVVVGGADSLCRMTQRGFASLGLVSPGVCRPCDAARDGISIGEAAGFALLERMRPEERCLAVLGTGGSSDAHHMSTPHPESLGAVMAMRAALADAGLEPEAIDYLNLHGTGTRANDIMEDRAVLSVFGPNVPCSGTKGWTGHTMGCSGILEAAISAICIAHGLIPGCLGVTRLDPALGARIATTNQRRDLRRVMTNSFGFGGINCSLILGVTR